MSFTSGQILTAAQLNTFSPGTKILVPDGAVGAPSIAFADDTDTGIYSASADTVNIATAGVLRATINSSGITASLVGNVTGDVTGNADTATALETARTINGVSFDGSANITVTAAAGTLTGATLNSGVTASSLTSVGTLTSLGLSGDTTSTGHFTAQSGGADSGIVLGQAFSSSYVGLRTAGMAETGDEYILINDGSITLLSAATGGDVYIRAGGNSSTCQILLDESENNVAVTGTMSVSGILTTSDEIRGGSGSAADPVFVFDSDSDTGMYSYGTNSIGFACGGGAAVRISSVDDLYINGDYLAFNSVSSVNDSIRVNGDQFQFRTGGTDRMHLTSAGYLEVSGNRYYFGINSNDYIVFDDSADTFQFVIDGTGDAVINFNDAGNLLIPAGGGFMGADSGSQYPTGSGTDARIITGFGVSTLVKSSSVRAEKENISTDLGTHLTVGMVDSIVPKMWNRIIAPGYPEIGPIAEDMDAISPFLSTAGTDADGEHLLMGVNSQTWMSLLTLAIQDLRTRVATLEAA